MFNTVLCNKILNRQNHTGLITMTELATLQRNRKIPKKNIRKLFQEARNYINLNEENIAEISKIEASSILLIEALIDLEKENNERITGIQTLTENIITRQ